MAKAMTRPEPDRSTRIGPLIITYHYCHGADYPFPGLKGITPERFDRQLSQLEQHMDVVPLRRLFEPDRDPDRPTAVITVDDGLADFHSHMLPVLADHGLAATIFVSSAPYQTGRLLDVHRVHLLQADLGPDRFRGRFQSLVDGLPEPPRAEDISGLGLGRLYPHDTETVRRFKTDLNYRLPLKVVGDLLSSMMAERFGDEAELVDRYYMTLDQLDDCLDKGMELGLHTHSHRVMSRLDEAEQAEELDRCLEFFTNRFGLREFAFCYPYGTVGTYSPATVRLLAQRQPIYSGVTLARRPVRPEDLGGCYEVSRYDVRDVFDDEDNLNSSSIEANQQQDGRG